MLPPFVPPSARMQGEVLPLITEFVVDRVERSFGSTFVVPDLESSDEAPQEASSWEAPVEEREVSLLPSIDEFLLRREEPEPVTATGWSTDETTVEAIAVEAVAVESAPVSHDDQADVSSSGDESVWNEEFAEPPADVPVEHAAELPPEATMTGSDDEPVGAGDEWVADERDAFDWNSVASLTVPADEERRAAEEWSTTDWERGAGESTSDHLATILAQVARRVRSGELTVQGTRQMSTEAALAAVLAALLAEPDADR